MLSSLDFGDNSVKVLVEEFRPALLSAGIATENIQPEWTRFKTLLYNWLVNLFLY